jgi:lipopolysaccharide export system protein LptA
VSKRHSESRLFLHIAFFFALAIFVSGNCSAAEVAGKPGGPVTITSEKLTADNKAGTALFEHQVTARTGEMTLHSEKMLVRYSQDSGNVTRIEAEGNVRFLRGNRVITSRAATYFSDDERVVFTGEPRAVEGENLVTGSRMTYFMNDDRFLVDDSKVFLTRGRRDRQ